MRLLAIVVILVMVLAIPLVARADISLAATATVTGGTALGPHALLKCTGYSYNKNGDPWAQCTNLVTSTALAFGTLTPRLKNSGVLMPVVQVASMLSTSSSCTFFLMHGVEKVTS